MATIMRVGGGGGGAAVSKIFGDGSDGDLYIAAGETVTLEVYNPYETVVEKNYKSITIESGGTLTCDANNAGLVLRCSGDCVIYGTIDQRAKSPKINPNNTFIYPEELVCGDGGSGGYQSAPSPYKGTAGMKNGGGWSGGGRGLYTTNGGSYVGGAGSAITDINIETPDSSIFVGGAQLSGYGGGAAGSNGGGGGGTSQVSSGIRGAGGNGPGGDGQVGSYTAGGGGGGGAGNYGGGVVLIYCGGSFTCNGEINCSGGNGGRGRSSGYSGGGGGGGAIYIVYNTGYENYGTMNVNGGAVGDTSLSGRTNNATAGGIGSFTAKQYEKGMTI